VTTRFVEKEAPTASSSYHRIGLVPRGHNLFAAQARPGDAILVSGMLGVMASRFWPNAKGCNLKPGAKRFRTPAYAGEAVGSDAGGALLA